MLNLNEQEMQKVYELSTRMWNARRQDLPVRENLIRALREELPEKEDCEEAVDSLRAGGAMLDSNLKKLETESLSSVLEGIVDRSLEGRDVQAQYHWLSSLLNSCLQAARENTGAPDLVFVPAENATAADVAALKAQVIDLVGSTGLAMIENLDAAGVMDEFSFTAEEQQALQDSATDETLNDYMELALYILYEQGEIKGLRGLPSGTGLEALGAVFRAALKMAQVKLEALLGKISWESALKALNTIASVLLTVLGSLLLGGAVLVLSALGLKLFAALIGSVLGVCALCLAGYHIYRLVQGVQNGTVQETLHEYWNRARQATEQAVTWAKVFGAWLKEKVMIIWESLQERLSQLQGRLETMAEQERAPSTHTVYADEEEVAPVQA